MMKRDQLAQMEMPDLVRYANEHFGLGVTKDYNKFDIINQIEQSMRKFKGNAMMRVVGDGDKGPVPPGMMKIRLRPGKHDRIPRPVIVGHQFKIASVPVNRDVIMPAKYLVCFEDAVQDVYFTDEVTKEWVCQEEHAYSYSVLEMGPPAIPRAQARPTAPINRPLASEYAEDEHYGLPDPTPAPAEKSDNQDDVLKAVLALGAQLESLTNRVDSMEHDVPEKPVPKATATKKRQPKKEDAKA